jgi:hypothetical protein
MPTFNMFQFIVNSKASSSSIFSILQWELLIPQHPLRTADSIPDHPFPEPGVAHYHVLCKPVIIQNALKSLSRTNQFTT